MAFVLFLDTILVPLSLSLTIGYHAYLCHRLMHKPAATTIGLNMLKRRSWLQDYNQGNDKKGMLAVQSLRNTLMASILTATITVIIVVSLAALTNNAFNAASHLFHGPLLGLHSGRLIVLKFGCAAIFLLASFMCSSMAIGYLIDANFLVNAVGGEFSASPSHTQTVLERGFKLAVVGNRALCMAFPVLLWMIGPVAVFVSSVALVWALHGLDFVRDFSPIAGKNSLQP
nr:uncharacterized protein LOC109181014 [Ipomoea batatas]